ncbi:3-phosphoglycerate kinase [Pseudomonas sp. NY15364]|uniref:3-phosphoglycerate kinase n=1 Tax=unclassified Pseudomonas TaxID=196821 RepID=UPI000CB11AF1|nr:MULTISPECIES: 3-phosphoglycerate kinase [Pseudomonas]MDH1867477.1 3-phosphoglycerate kinase [Pseudomonas chengduensis]PKQ42368.1 3-phosphoglycerate kinase [Pseudomonas sp. YY-1]
MKKIICLLLACMPLAAYAYPIEVEKQFNGAEVSATTQEIDHNMAALMLYNYGQSEAECSAVFQNGPEAPRIRRTVLAPGASNNMAVKFTRSVIRLRIKLTCNLK